MKIENGITWLNLTEAAELANVSRQTFYDKVQPLLTAKPIKGRLYYSKSEIEQYKENVKPVELPIIIHGIQRNFVKSLQEMGIPCTVENRGVPDYVPIEDKELANIFGVPVGTLIAKRGRLQGVANVPYRLVTNWYPAQYADKELLEEMRRNDDADMPALMKEKHGVVIEHITETVTTRTSTKEERRLLKMRSPGPVYEIRRINTATDGETTVMVSDIIMVARFFKLRYTYNTAHWVNQHSA